MEIHRFLEFMTANGASDLYFSADAPVLVKIEGHTRPAHERRLNAAEIKQLAYSMLSDTQIKRFEADWELNLGVTFREIGRFRVNLLREKGATAMVVRHVRSTPPTTEQLHLPSSLNELVMERRGLVLVAGATGSGKSSTLAALVDHRNAHDHCHILTVEEPIEFLHPYKKAIVNQREIGEDTRSYAAALKNAMREAPDVILIGEIRDVETMRSAIIYAETGHLCLATIHASNAIETLDRVLNMFDTEQRPQVLMDLSRNLRAVICQRLVPGVDGKRWPALERLDDSPYIRDLIARGEIGELRGALERNLEESIVTFDESLVELYRAGRITRETAISHADSRHNVEVRIRLLEDGQSDVPALTMAEDAGPLKAL